MVSHQNASCEDIADQIHGVVASVGSNPVEREHQPSIRKDLLAPKSILTHLVSCASQGRVRPEEKEDLFLRDALVQESQSVREKLMDFVDGLLLSVAKLTHQHHYIQADAIAWQCKRVGLSTSIHPPRALTVGARAAIGTMDHTDDLREGDDCPLGNGGAAAQARLTCQTVRNLWPINPFDGLGGGFFGAHLLFLLLSHVSIHASSLTYLALLDSSSTVLV
jgi:hypothetical protein